MKRILPFAIILVVLGSALGAAWYMKRAATTTSTPPAAPALPGGDTAASAPGKSSTSAPGAEPPHFRGSANAAVTLEEFGDFECPPCGDVYPVLKEIESEYGARLKVIFREYPLTANHPHALPAARSAEAAGLQGKFFEMHDLLYENQKKWKEMFDVRPEFEEYAKRIGLDVERWKKDRDSDAVYNRIFLDGLRAHALNVKGTPSVFVNGVEVPFAELNPQGLKTALDKAFSQAGH